MKCKRSGTPKVAFSSIPYQAAWDGLRDGEAWSEKDFTVMMQAAVTSPHLRSIIKAAFAQYAATQAEPAAVRENRGRRGPQQDRWKGAA